MRYIEQIAEFIKDKKYNIYSIAEISGDGEAVAAEIIPANPCQNSYSVAKVFIVTAIGILCDRGRLDTEDKALDILAKYIPGGMDERWRDVTIDMLIRHMIGLPGGFLDIDSFDSREFGEDYLGYMLSYRLSKDHGEVRSYTDGAYYMLVRVVEEIVGEPLDSFLWKELFYKLGFSEMAWSKCPQGHCIGGSGLYIKTEDMVKLGGLYLNRGVWHGERIISEKWIDTVYSRGYELRLNGFAEGYGKSGMRGQMLTVFPKYNVAFAWHGYGFKEAKELLYFISQIIK